jgi:hypothetical protein
MNTPVSFSITKSVIKRGFDKECKKYWNLLEYSTELDYSTEWIVEDRINPDSIDNMYAPSIADVIMWLYEKYGIWISVSKDWDIGILLGFESVIDTNGGFIDCGTFKTPTEAYEAAILCTLKNMK